jgi:hypothetical protein
MPEQIPYFELDMSAPDPEPEQTGDRRRRLRLGPRARLWLAILTALAVGAALGGLGVRKERDAAATREARNTISLAATVGSNGYDPTGRADAFPVNVRIYNAGPKRVRVLDATLSVPGFHPGLSSAGTTDVEPQKWSLITVALGLPNCSETAAGPPTLEILAQTSAGTRRRTSVPAVDAGGSLPSIRDSTCMGPPGILGAVDLSVHPPLSFAERSGRPVLRVTLDASVQVLGRDNRQAMISGEGRTDLLRTRPVESYPVRIAPPSQVSGEVELSIISCRRPLGDYGEDDLQIPIRVSSDAGESTLRAWASPAVYVGITELYHRTCD